MSLILSLETATKNCSVSLSESGKVRAVREIAEVHFSHAEKLHLFIEELFNEVGCDSTALSAVAVSQGPGSYTGLRIGVSAAKGLCYALDIPLIALDTLEILARRISVDDGVIIPLLDARRMEVFTAVFDQNYTKIEPTQALVIEKGAFVSYATTTIHLLGDGAAKCKEVLELPNGVYHDELVYPSAREMAAMAYAQYQREEFVDVAYFEPFYLKDFVSSNPKKN